MTDQLPLPPELQRLIEKREDEDRRSAQRRSGQERREDDVGPLGRMQSPEDLQQLPLVDQRSGERRREDRDRRRQGRRDADADPSSSDTPA